MKVISWNCNGAFRNKHFLLEHYDADIIVVQECEDPSRSTKKFQTWSKNYLWKGNNKNKGIGVFVKDNIVLDELFWMDKNTLNKNEELELFLPFSINKSIIFLGVWTKQANSPSFAYIGQFWKYLQMHKSVLKNDKTIILGDFNSNSIWDQKDRWWNHSDVIDELEDINLYSLYHFWYKEAQGKEMVPTFYHRKNLERPYHIDYIFLSQKLLQKCKSLEIGDKQKWLKFSDHLPMIFEF